MHVAHVYTYTNPFQNNIFLRLKSKSVKYLIKLRRNLFIFKIHFDQIFVYR